MRTRSLKRQTEEILEDPFNTNRSGVTISTVEEDDLHNPVVVLREDQVDLIAEAVVERPKSVQPKV